MAASAALPPWRSASIPAWAAIGEAVAATSPLRPSTIRLSVGMITASLASRAGAKAKASAIPERLRSASAAMLSRSFAAADPGRTKIR